LDLKDAFLEVQVDSATQELLTINTHRGLFRYRRLFYGLKSAPALFQSVIDAILQGIEGVVSYIDDILIKGRDYEDCLSTLCKVFARLAKHNVKIKYSKCRWFEPEVEFLGNILSSSGRRPAPSKSASIVNAKTPENVRDVRSFLGLVEFYASYLPHLSTIAKPISALTKSGVEFSWNSECVTAFETIKNMLKDKVLMHFNPELELILMTDASPVGLGIALCHPVFHNGTRMERPILFASTTLNERQSRYSQIDREAMAVIFGVKNAINICTAVGFR